MSIDTGKLAPHLQGKVSKAWIDLLNWWQPATIFFLGSAGDLISLLNQLNYNPARVIFRLWWQHDLNWSGGVVHITPDNWQDMMLWARETSEYQQHKDQETGQIFRPDFPDQYAEHWPPGTNPERKCVQKWMDWVKPDLLAIRGLPNVYVVGFLHGIKDQITDEVFTFEQNRMAALWYGFEGNTQHKLKTMLFNFATGQYAPDKGFWYSPQFGSFAATLKAMPWNEIGFHAYWHGSAKFEFGECVVTKESPDLFPLEPHVYAEDFRIYPGNEMRAYAAFLPHKVYQEVLVPAGLGAININATESGPDRVYGEAWPKMKEVYYRNQEPGGAWEYAYQDAQWPVSHWRHLKFLDPYWDAAGGDPILAAQFFLEHDLAWASLQDDVYPELQSRCLFQFFDPNWPNYRLDNFLAMDRLAAAREKVKGGNPPPPPPPPPPPDEEPPKENFILRIIRDFLRWLLKLFGG